MGKYICPIEVSPRINVLLLFHVKQSNMYSQKRQKGNIAEELVVSHLKNKGFSIIDQNYLRKWGEIDIVAEKNGKIHFIEIKSSFLSHVYGFNCDISVWKCVVSCETPISHVMPEADPPPAENTYFDPVWNMTNKKKLRFSRVIRTYLDDRYGENMPDFQVDLISVSLDYSQKIAYINEIKNIVFE